MKIVFASGNKGKIKEIRGLLHPLNIDVIPQDELGVTDVAETGLTFVENAIIKARHACAATDLPVLADDSGLEVLALNGEPGIYSARYAGPDANSEANIQKLLTKLKNIPEKNRQAAFHCTLVLMLHASDPTPLICQGTWHGLILQAPRGHQGFGYDPIFYDLQHQCSAAELTPDIKNKLSHRGQALRLLLENLAEKIHASPISQ